MRNEGEIIAVFPERGYAIVRSSGANSEEFYGHFNSFLDVISIFEIRKGARITFVGSGSKEGKRARALQIKMGRAEHVLGAA